MLLQTQQIDMPILQDNTLLADSIGCSDHVAELRLLLLH